MQALIGNSTVASKVINLLREEIIAGRLAEGLHITIKEIAGKYNVSPMPVREAFRALEGERLLEIVPYKGAIVNKIDETFFLSVLDICDALEAYMAEVAMFKVGETEIEQLVVINEQIAVIRDTPRDLSKHLDLNTAFHALIFAWAKNEIAQSLHSYYHSLARMVRGRYRHSYSRIQEVVGEHNDIIQAFRSRDSYVLKRAVDYHAKKAKENLLQQYKCEQ